MAQKKSLGTVFAFMLWAVAGNLSLSAMEQKLIPDSDIKNKKISTLIEKIKFLQNKRLWGKSFTAHNEILHQLTISELKDFKKRLILMNKIQDLHDKNPYGAFISDIILYEMEIKDLEKLKKKMILIDEINNLYDKNNKYDTKDKKTYQEMDNMKIKDLKKIKNGLENNMIYKIKKQIRKRNKVHVKKQ